MNKSIGSLLVASLAVALAASSLATAQNAPGTGTGTGTGQGTGQGTGTGAPAKERSKEDRKEKKEEKREKAGGATIGQPAPNFTLTTTDGKEWSLSDAKGKIVILQWCNPECPACRGVMDDGVVANTIKGVKESASDAVYVMINSSSKSPSSLDKTGAYMKEHNMDVPALLDRDGKVGLLYDAKTTPHCFVIDDKGVLRYQGAIDDSNGGKNRSMNYVVNAVKQIKAGETVNPEKTRPFGCSVKNK